MLITAFTNALFKSQVDSINKVKNDVTDIAIYRYCEFLWPHYINILNSYGHNNRDMKNPVTALCKHLILSVITRLKSLKDKIMLACLKLLFKKYK